MLLVDDPRDHYNFRIGPPRRARGTFSPDLLALPHVTAQPYPQIREAALRRHLNCITVGVRYAADMPPSKSLGNTIYDARVAKDISLREAARQLDIAPSYLSDIENDRRVPAEEVLRRIATLMALDFDNLMALGGRVGEQAERYLRQQPAAGVLFRRLAEGGASAKDVEALITQYDETTKRRGGT